MEENTENYEKTSPEEFKEILRGNRAKYNHAGQQPRIIIVKIEKIILNEEVFIDTEHIPEHIKLEINSCIFSKINFSKIDNDLFEDNHNSEHNNLKKASKREYSKPLILNIINSSFEKITIYSGSFEELKIEGKDTIVKNLRILEGNFNHFEISNGIIETLKIENGEFEQFEIIAGEFKKRTTIKNLNIKKDLMITGGSFQKLTIENGIFNGNVIFGSTNDVPLSFVELIIKKGDFKIIKFRNGLYEKVSLKKEVIIKEYCVFSKGEYKNHVFVGGGMYQQLRFLFGKELNINELKFQHTVTAKYIYLEKSEGILNKLTFENADIIAGTLIKISDIPINNITFNNSVNAGNIIFSGIKVRPILQRRKVHISSNEKVKEEAEIIQELFPIFTIHNSDIGKTTFIDCDFEQAYLLFKSSKITEVFLAGTKMPKEITTNDKEQKRLGYGQLKKIYENRGDTVTANEYFAKEMNVLYDDTLWFGDKKNLPNKYYKKFKWLKKRCKAIKFRGESFSEKLALGLNKFSSNHGTSWGTAFRVIIVFSIISFAIYGCCIGLSPASWFEVKNRDIFWNYFGYILEYINPIRKPDSIVEGMNTYLNIENNTTGLNYLKANGFPMIWDGISRILNSYFIYQLIQAFRKHRRGS